MLKISSALSWGRSVLRDSGIVDYDFDSKALLAFSLGTTIDELYLRLDNNIPADKLARYRSFISRRQNHEPTFQIIGILAINGLNLKLTKDVLTPRLETEILIDEAKKAVNGFIKPKVLDLGTGSGFIILSLAKNISGPKYFASDISSEALRIAKKNAKENGLQKEVVFRIGDMFEPWNSEKFDIIIANLPYVPVTRKSVLQDEVVKFEPPLAIFSGDMGLDAYRVFFKNVSDFIAPRGFIIIEFDETQGKEINKIVKKYLPDCSCDIVKDLAGLDRIAIIKKEINKEEK